MVVIILLLLFAWETRESVSEIEGGVDTFMGKFVEFVLVCFKLSDEVYKVLGLSELGQVFSINNISQFIFNLDDKFNNIERVQSVFLEG